MNFKKFIKMHHNLIISVIDVIQIANIFVNSAIVSILIILFRSLMRERK